MQFSSYSPKTEWKRIPLSSLSIATPTSIIEVKESDNLPLETLQQHSSFLFDIYDFSTYISYLRQDPSLSSSLLYHYPATTYALLRIHTYYKVTHIMIGEPLLFQVNDLSLLRQSGFILHASPLLSLNPALAAINEPPINHFFLLPQHLSLYEPYIDILEIGDKDPSRQQALINIYTSPEYPYSLSLLFNQPSLDKVYGSHITPSFVQHRFNCRQRCLAPSHSCHYCENLLHSLSLRRKINDKTT